MKKKRMPPKTYSKNSPYDELIASTRMLIVLIMITFGAIGSYWFYKTKANTVYSLNSYPQVASDPSYPPKLLPAQRVLERGNVTGYGFWNVFQVNSLPQLHFHDTVTGATQNVALSGCAAPWQQVWARDGTLWTIGGSGPIIVCHFQFDNTNMPRSATLLQAWTFGDANSRTDDIIQLESGAIVGMYHQQTSWSQTVLYMVPGSQNWQQFNETQIYTSSSKARLIQHPADKSLWVFRDPDAWGAIEAIRYTEEAGGLKSTFLDTKYIWRDEVQTSTGTEVFGPDGENPDIEVAPDPSSGDIVIAYQSSDRQMWNKGTGKYVYGEDFINVSYPVVARIKADKTKSFIKLHTYVERITQLGLIVRQGEVWLAYQPVDPNTYAFDKLYLSLYRNGAWEPATYMTTLDTSGTKSGSHMAWVSIISGISRPEIITMAEDNVDGFPGIVTLFTMLASGSSDTTPPSVSLASPVNGATVAGQVNVSVNASDNVGVYKVELFVNNVLYRTTYQSPYNFAWDTTQVANGNYTLMAKAYDTSGLMRSASISVTVQNQSSTPSPDTIAPSATINSPLPNATISGNVAITGQATDNIGVTKIVLMIDGKATSSFNGNSINYTWNTKRVKRGQHAIELWAYDNAGNVGKSSITVTK